MGAGGRTVRHRVQPHHRVQISASAVPAQGICKPAGGGLRLAGIDITLFGETFKWNILGYDAAHGGLPYFCAYMVAMVIGECINFPIQRNFVFRSKGNLAKQIGWYLLAFCLITCIVNSINCIWVAVAGLLVPDFIYNIGTTVLNGGISMIIFFFVNKIIFPEGEAAK